jgi:hypothetical protein
MKRFVFAAFGWAAFCVIITLAGIVMQSTWHGTAVQAQAPGYASRIVPQPSLPANCTPGNGDVVYLTTGNIGLYTCKQTNVWRPVDSLGYLNVMSYGATGNGVADDTVAVQAALDAAYNGGVGLYIGNTVFFPIGTYLTTATLNVPFGVSLMGVGVAGGAGAGASVINCTSAVVPAITYTAGGSTFWGSNISRLLIIGGAGGCVLINNGQAIRIHDCILKTSGVVILNTGATQWNQFDHCEISDLVANTKGISFSGGSHLGIAIKDFQFRSGTVAQVWVHANSALITSEDNQYLSGTVGLFVDGDVSGGAGYVTVNSVNDYFATQTASSISVNPDAFPTKAPAVTVLNSRFRGGGASVNGILSNPVVTSLTVIGTNFDGYTGADVALGNMTGTAAAYYLVGNQYIDANKITGSNPTPTVTTFSPFMFRNLVLTTVLFADLGTPANGTVYYCPDCTIASPCMGAGTGSIAKYLNGVWVCN